MWEKIISELQILLNILDKQFFHNSVEDYLVGLVIFLISIFAIKIFQKILLYRRKKLSEKKSVPLGNFFFSTCEKTIIPLLYFGAFYLSIRHLELSHTINRIVYVAGIILFTILTVRFAIKLAEYALKIQQEKEIARTVSQGVFTLIKIVAWSFGLIFLLDNLGFKISAVIAGLGIGGIAVALASQTILSDLFNYFVILFDKPFQIGDFIIVGDYMGVIEYTGIKTTRIRSLSGEQLIIANTDLTNSRIRNYKRMEQRRVAFKFGVTYQSTLVQLKEIPAIITNIVKAVPETQLDRVHFASYGDFSLIFEVVYYARTNDYNKYMDMQQAINLAIKEEFEKRKIEMAYPTQMLYVK